MRQIGSAVDAQYLEREIALAKSQLSKKEKNIRQLGEAVDDDGDDGEGGLDAMERLAQIQLASESLSLAADITEWKKRASETKQDELIDEGEREVDLFEQLAVIIRKHKDSSEVQTSIYPERYLPFYRYLRDFLTQSIRRNLSRSKYPSKSACAGLLRDDTFLRTCDSLVKVQAIHEQVAEDMRDDESSMKNMKSDLLILTFAPLVERIKFHFVEASSDRVTSTKIERLPEWLIAYCRENILDNGPWKLIKKGLSKFDSSLPVQFLNEITMLIRWVLAQRNFFRDGLVVGPRSNPMLLCNAIEQLLQYDSDLRDVLPPTLDASSADIISLMDICIGRDDELMKWWLVRERETMFATLFDTETVIKPLVHRVSPRAEIFCAAIRSVQYKAALLSTSTGQMYLKEVAVPLCVQFVDAVHDTSNDLRQLMSQRSPINLGDLESNITEWIEVINGTRLAAKILLRESAWQESLLPSSQSDHDLARFGRSLERLETVLVEEFASSFVETLLMERAKLASYLMLASHLLSSEEWDNDDSDDLSNELRETHNLLVIFQRVCRGTTGGEHVEERSDVDVAGHELSAHVMNRLADKFLEIALDVHRMIPDLYHVGASVFARDVQVIMSDAQLPSVARLIDITRLLQLGPRDIDQLLSALGGLVGATTFLDVNDFHADEVVHDEATSMLKAKGFRVLDLDDAVSILNRRRDVGLSDLG